MCWWEIVYEIHSIHRACNYTCPGVGVSALPTRFEYYRIIIWTSREYSWRHECLKIRPEMIVKLNRNYVPYRKSSWKISLRLYFELWNFLIKEILFFYLIIDFYWKLDPPFCFWKFRKWISIQQSKKPLKKQVYWNSQFFHNFFGLHFESAIFFLILRISLLNKSNKQIGKYRNFR